MQRPKSPDKVVLPPIGTLTPGVTVIPPPQVLQEVIPRPQMLRQGTLPRVISLEPVKSELPVISGTGGKLPTNLPKVTSPPVKLPPIIPMSPPVRLPQVLPISPPVSMSPQIFIPPPTGQVRFPQLPQMPQMPMTPVQLPQTLQIPQVLRVPASPQLPLQPPQVLRVPASPQLPQIPQFSQQIPYLPPPLPHLPQTPQLPQQALLIQQPPGPLVVLRRSQIPHYERIVTVIQRTRIFFDKSKTGTGKTWIVGKLVQEFDFGFEPDTVGGLMIVCPKGVVSHWAKFCRDHNIKKFMIMNYNELRGTEVNPPTHGLLTMVNTYGADGKKKTEYHVTETFKRMVAGKMLLIFDEAHSLKNNSLQHKAATALIREIMEDMKSGSSRVGLLSATPFDKEDKAVNFLRMMGFIRSPKLYTTRDGFQLEGLAELIAVCYSFNHEATQNVLIDDPPNSSNAQHVVYRLFIMVIRPYISSSMPHDIDQPLDAKNGFYNLDQKDAFALNVAIEKMQQAARYDPSTGVLRQWDRNTLTEIKEARQGIEAAKVNTFIRLVNRELTMNPNVKVIVFTNFLATIDSLYEGLRNWSPLILTGDTSTKNRDAIIAAFNTDPRYRLWIGTTATGGVGISLHDTVGNAPRVLFESPDFNVTLLHQGAGRIYRSGLKSPATVRIVYGKTGAMEVRILEAIARKTSVLKDIVNEDEEDSGGNVLFPGDYEEMVEP